MPNTPISVDEAVNEALRPYVPRLLVDWLRSGDTTRVREVPGTLAFADISGFTKMTERLARKGKVGAEEMNDLLDDVFTRAARDRLPGRRRPHQVGRRRRPAPVRGRRITPRARAEPRTGCAAPCANGDGCRVPPGSCRSACPSASTPASSTSSSSGDAHRELIIAGPDATRTVTVESQATAGEILLSAATAAELDPVAVGRPKEDGFLLRSAPEVPYPGWVPPPRPRRTRSRTRPARRPAGPSAGSGGSRGRASSGRRSRSSSSAGPTSSCAREGAEAVADALDECVRTVQEESARHAVTFLDSDISHDGGKILLVAGAPSSSGHDEEAMLLAVRSIMDRSGTLPLRIGVNAGRVFAARVRTAVPTLVLDPG